jgi:hypothetical protein
MLPGKQMPPTGSCTGPPDDARGSGPHSFWQLSPVGHCASVMQKRVWQRALAPQTSNDGQKSGAFAALLHVAAGSGEGAVLGVAHKPAWNTLDRTHSCGASQSASLAHTFVARHKCSRQTPPP